MKAIKQIQTPIIPVRQNFITLPEREKKIDLKAICAFMASGFFLDDDTYYQNQKVLKPGTNYSGALTSPREEAPWFEWYHEPEDKSLNKWIDEFAKLFEGIMHEQTRDTHVVLPLSGGLDSRTQAAALQRLGSKVTSFCYAFRGGHDETHYGKKIAKQCGFDFIPLIVNSGYLWNTIEELAKINQCYSDFTHPRQMAFKDHFPDMGEHISLGHWGDVLFNSMGLPEGLSFDQQVSILMNKIGKRGGWELAEDLWSAWELEGTFTQYFTQRIRKLLSRINIKNPNARFRAFKSLHWAPRWTSINLSVFEKALPISLPYYDQRMCKFICNIPEKFLAGRKIQIGYIKKYAPDLARIVWQDKRPFNLFNYQNKRVPWNLPYRSWQKAKRTIRDLADKPIIQRNWELQFLGAENQKQLHTWLMNERGLKQLLPPNLPEKYFRKFTNFSPLQYSHPVSMLLTLSTWNQLLNNPAGAYQKINH